jgi:hypothetical protein
MQLDGRWRRDLVKKARQVEREAAAGRLPDDAAQ